MSGKAGVQGNAHVGMRQRLKAIFPKRFLSPASSARSHIAPPKEQTNSRGSSSLDVQTTAPLEGEAHSIAHVWNEAWNFIQSEEPDLVAKYQQYLFAQDDPDAKPGSEQVSGIERKEKLLRTAGCKVTDAKAKLAEESGFSSHAKRVAEGTVTILIKGAAFVAAVASNEPHAALVWAGCSVILPLLLNPGTERTAALEGFADAARILCRFSVVEADLSNDPAARPLSDADVVRLKDQLRIYLVQLYAMIIKLQIRLVLRYDRAAAARFFRDTVKADDWESLVKNIKELEESNLRDISVIGQHVLLHVQNTIELQGQQLALGFVEMTRRLQGLQEGIENIQRESTARGDATEDSNCVNAFKTGINYILQKDKNSVCAPESGQWFFHHPEYEAFRAAREPQLLFVTAEAGGGKSTTMRTLIDTLQASDELPLIAYFFFKDDDDRLRSYDEAMSTMIYQLLVKERGLVQHAREPHRQYGDAIRHQTKEMWQIIVKIASQSRRDIFCILDAVDECSAPGRKQLVADLADAFQNMVQSTSRLRFAVSSRPYQDENHPYADLAASNNTRHLAGEDAQVQSDIRKVIRFKVQELAQKRQLNQSIQNMLVTRLSDQNVQTRSFLAVRMAFELLDSHHRMHKGAGERTIDIILADIPQQLGDQFDEMLKRSLDREHAWRLFSVILAVRRTLKIAEFKAIYSLTQPTTGAIAPARSYDELEMPTDDEEFKRFVRSRCGLFITFVRNSVHLFHQTAREHLLAKTAVSGKTPYAGPAQVWGGQKDHSGAKHGSTWKGCISETDSNLVCATVCLDILTFTVSRTWVLEV
ncbi:ankyrin repeat protein [Colletotrichum cereale]|nr:ankyrin repeat protein [Colletotrichum cereale]